MMQIAWQVAAMEGRMVDCGLKGPDIITKNNKRQSVAQVTHSFEDTHLQTEKRTCGQPAGDLCSFFGLKQL